MAKERREKFKPERDSNSDLCDARAVLYQLSCQANWELQSLCGSMISPWIVDLCVLIIEISFELRMETVSMSMIIAVMLCYLSSSERKA